jgi:DNA-binding transcriptional regulator YdaS (Cro superfamily)
MKLDKLILSTAWTEASLAEAVGVVQSTINNLRRNKRTASPQLSLGIERATGGLVRRSDLPITPATRKLLAQLP